MSKGVTASDCYIMSVRNKQISIYKKGPDGNNKVGFDSGRAMSDLPYAHGDNFFAVLRTKLSPN